VRQILFAYKRETCLVRELTMTLRSSWLALAASLLMFRRSLLWTARFPRSLSPAPANSLGTIDAQRIATLNGVVKFVQLGPERSRCRWLVTTPQGKTQEWSLEGPTQNIIPSSAIDAARLPWDNVTFQSTRCKDAICIGEIRTTDPPGAFRTGP